jgi:hypothetical protein
MCKNDNPGFFTNGIPAMKNPDELRIFPLEFLGGKYKQGKKCKKHGAKYENGVAYLLSYTVSVEKLWTQNIRIIHDV